MGQIVIVATLEVKPEYTDEVIVYLKKELIEQSRAEAGNKRYDLHQVSEEANKLVIVELWASQQVIDEHNASDHFQAFVGYIEDKVNALDIKVMEKIA